MTDNPDNFGKQFDDIIGSNFTPQEKNEAVGNAMGEHLFNETDKLFGGYKEAVQRDAAERMQHVALIYPKLVHHDEDGMHIKYTSPKGWTHTWYGGAYIEHSHPESSYGKDQPVEVSNVSDYRTGKIKELSADEFMDICHDVDRDCNPKDY
jgi:hypothetical protein